MSHARQYDAPNDPYAAGVAPLGYAPPPLYSQQHLNPSQPPPADMLYGGRYQYPGEPVGAPPAHQNQPPAAVPEYSYGGGQADHSAQHHQHYNPNPHAPPPQPPMDPATAGAKDFAAQRARRRRGAIGVGVFLLALGTLLIILGAAGVEIWCRGDPEHEEYEDGATVDGATMTTTAPLQRIFSAQVRRTRARRGRGSSSCNNGYRAPSGAEFIALALPAVAGVLILVWAAVDAQRARRKAQQQQQPPTEA